MDSGWHITGEGQGTIEEFDRGLAYDGRGKGVARGGKRIGVLLLPL